MWTKYGWRGQKKKKQQQQQQPIRKRGKIFVTSEVSPNFNIQSQNRASTRRHVKWLLGNKTHVGSKSTVQLNMFDRCNYFQGLFVCNLP